MFMLVIMKKRVVSPNLSISNDFGLAPFANAVESTGTHASLP